MSAVRKAIAAALVLLSCVSAPAETQRWSDIEYFYKPEVLDSLAGRVFSLESLKAGTPRPFGKLHFVHGEFGAAASARPGGCSAFDSAADDDADPTSVGWSLDTACSPLSDDPLHRFANMQANVAWAPADQPRPWASESSRFGMEFSLQLPRVRVSDGAKAYVTAQVGVEDGDGHFFWLQPTVLLAGFAAGAERKDGRGLDPSGPYINPMYRDRGRYLSKFENPRTGQVSDVTGTRPFAPWRWYAFTVSRAQLLAAVADLNANGSRFSTDPSRYRVSLIGVQAEVNRQAGTGGKTPQGWIGVGLKQLHAYRLY